MVNREEDDNKVECSTNEDEDEFDEEVKDDGQSYVVRRLILTPKQED